MTKKTKNTKQTKKQALNIPVVIDSTKRRIIPNVNIEETEFLIELSYQ